MADRYKIKGKLGRGGIGAVYRAYDTHLEREVAIKRLLPLEETYLNEMDPDSLLREASALAKFQHPNVVTIFAFEEDEEGPFVVTELIRGENLKETIEKGALEVDDFQEFVSQTLDAMIAAQQMDLLHRDIKPANLMLTFLPSGRFQVKILDFGLAKFSETPSQQTLDQKGSFLGSIDYIAPEQFLRQPLDQRTDLYSLGCVCYFALTQIPSFKGKNNAETMDNHLKHRVTPISEYRPDLPPAIRAWVMRMISLAPSDRPLNATAANAEFEQAKIGIAPQLSAGNEMPSQTGPVVEVTPAPPITTSTSSLNPETGKQPTPPDPIPARPQASEASTPLPNRQIVTGSRAPIRTKKANLSHLSQPTSKTGQRQFQQQNRPLKKGLPPTAIAGIVAGTLALLIFFCYFIFKDKNEAPEIAKGPKPAARGKPSPGKGTNGGGNLQVTQSRPANTTPFKPEPRSTSGETVNVYILAGEANMLGMGQVAGDGTRWGNEFIDPEVSLYKEKYSSGIDCDKLQPIKTEKLKSFGGVKPTPYPQGGETYVTRGFIEMKNSGVYEFRPGYAASTNNIMEVDGKEVHRQEPGKTAKRTPIELSRGVRVPFKITYLTKVADGLGWHARTDVPGVLNMLVKDENKFPFLLNKNGNWKTRDDVWYKGVAKAKGDQWLSVGCGSQHNFIGPELGFGHVVGDYHDEDVILIKAAQGNRSLGWDFLPPGSKSFEFQGNVFGGYQETPKTWKKGTTPKPIDWYGGKQYDDGFGAVRKALENFDRTFPKFKGRPFEIAGFVWWQGQADGKPPYSDRYKQNLTQLVKSLRRDFSSTNAPFVIGTVGFQGRKMNGGLKSVAEAQLSVSDEKQNIITVDTRDFWKPANLSPKNLVQNYNQNAETFINVGQALGQAMVKLQKQSQ